MSWHLFHCRTKPGGILLAFAMRDLFVLGLVHLSKTLRVILRGSHLPQYLVAHLKYTCYISKAFKLLILAWGCFVVLRLWLLIPSYAILAHAQPLGWPRVSWLLPKPYWARLTLLDWSKSCQSVLKSPSIKFSH